MWCPMSPFQSDPLIILASKSPRRRYLLEQAGLTFSVVPSHFDESTIPVAEPSTFVKQLAAAKAVDVALKCPKSWVIGADTIVSIDQSILGKPGSVDDAQNMLRHLSGRTHQVYTGYCVLCRSQDRQFLDVVKTDVQFKNLTTDEINWYIHTREPFDKAGAYAIQGLGTFLVKRINGSYTNVVGLPVCEVIELLIRENVVGFKLDIDNNRKLSGGHT